MKVAIDTGALRSGHKVRGIGVMVEEQIKALQNEAKKDKNIKIEEIDFENANLDEYDVVHYPYFFPYFNTLPEVFPKAKTVVTIQDLIYLVFPDRYPPGISGRKVFREQKRKIRKVNKIVTISNTSKKDIIKYLKINPAKIDVVHLAPKNIFKNIKDIKRLEKTRKKFNLPKEFVLYVGDVNYNKNIITLIKACQKSKINLVIVGKQATEIEEMGLKLDSIQGPMDWVRYVFNIPHPELQHFRDLNEVLKDSDNIVRTGYVSQEDLVNIYNLATVYCQPSLYEGFGLPVLEAMACNIPVIISDTPALREIAGNAASKYETENSFQLAKVLKSLLKDNKMRKTLINRGEKQVKKFSWSKYAIEMIKVYKNVFSS